MTCARLIPSPIDTQAIAAATLISLVSVTAGSFNSFAWDILKDCEIEAAREVVVDLINHLLSHLQDPDSQG